MIKEFLIVLFNIVFFINNLFYIELIEGIFDIKSRKSKIFAFSLGSSIIGTIMLVWFGSMSALGYSIMLVVYFITIMNFYKNQSFIAKLACVFHFNLHIMVARAIISSLFSYAFNRSIYDLSTDVNTFWLVLICTSVLTSLITVALLRLIPPKFLRIMGQRTDHLILYIAILVMGNIYMIANGNIYIHNIDYPWLQLHQILAALCWLFAAYVGIFMLVGYDIVKEHRETLEKDIIYKHVLESQSLAIIEVNCSLDAVTRFIKRGQLEPLLYDSYTEYRMMRLKEYVHPKDLEMVSYHISSENIINHYKKGHKMLSLEARTLLSDSTIRWTRYSITSKLDIDTDNIIAIITVMDDIHDVKINEMKLLEKSQTDSLVGAYNKKTTEILIADYLSESRTGALLMIDLDNFKSINDTFGHAYGDEVLIEVHEKLTTHFRTDDIIGRVGGDEFIAFYKNNSTADTIAKKAAKICSHIQKVYHYNGESVEISCSIGVSLAPQHGHTFETLYHKADLAMYKCKKEAKNGYSIYSDNS